MKSISRFLAPALAWICMVTVAMIFPMASALGDDLQEVTNRGVLRHLGVPYANFVTGSGDGMDVELITLFAQYLGIRYEYVETSWDDVIGDLSGKRVKSEGGHIEILGNLPIKGDIIANGFTILPWRQQIIEFSVPIFPSQVWLLARAESTLRPIIPSGDIDNDIRQVKKLIQGRTVMGKAKTCLDPSLYNLGDTGADIRLFGGNLNELAPAIINQDAECTILDVPDALIALKKWPGKIKVIGPVSAEQEMGCGFRKTSPLLRDAFNKFIQKIKLDGIYAQLVNKYYPAVFAYYPAFFQYR